MFLFGFGYNANMFMEFPSDKAVTLSLLSGTVAFVSRFRSHLSKTFFYD